MLLNDCSKIAEQQWHWLGEQYPYVVLHEFVVMPNHIHGIIEINRSRIVLSDQYLSGAVSCQVFERLACALNAKQQIVFQEFKNIIDNYEKNCSTSGFTDSL
jgi:REP element-mobilizing transposase RayT